MNPLRSFSLRGVLVTTVLAVAAATVWTARIDAQTNIYGLWRDPDGGLWCGGTCGAGQQCCAITPLAPHTPG